MQGCLKRDGYSLSRPTRMMLSMMVCMVSTAWSSVNRSTRQSMKLWLPGMRTGAILKVALQFKKDAGNGLVARGCEMMCHALRMHMG